jgi:hypothetical protein
LVFIAGWAVDFNEFLNERFHRDFLNGVVKLDGVTGLKATLGWLIN